jgi:hypothetical protein
MYLLKSFFFFPYLGVDKHGILPNGRAWGDFSGGISVQRYRWFHFTYSKCPEGFDSSDTRPGNWLRWSIFRDLSAGHILERYGCGEVSAGIYPQEIPQGDLVAAKYPQESTCRTYPGGICPDIFSYRHNSQQKITATHSELFHLFFLSEPYQYIQRDWHCHLRVNAEDNLLGVSGPKGFRCG